MDAIEINFDGLIGPTHNYAGLSFGNVASSANSGDVSRPRAGALQGLAKMRALIRLGLRQGVLPPQERPRPALLRALGFSGSPEAMAAALWREDPALFSIVFSASPMWTANAATVSPAPDCADGRTHLTVANLAAMPHRAFEADETHRQLATAFADPRFAVHRALPGGAHLGDEGAANFMRVAPSHGAAGVEIFVYGAETGGRFPARQRLRASQAVARLHGLDPARTAFLRQADAAIQAGAFHNDVVAVANERVLFTHAEAFEDQGQALAELRDRAPFMRLIEAPTEAVSLGDAVQSYLFNSQLVTLPSGETALIAPGECRENPRVWAYLERLLSEGALDRVEIVDLRESMKNGGGPACLRLRVAVSTADAARIDPRFLLDEAKIDRIAGVVEALWPATIDPTALGDPALWAQARAARAALLDAMGFAAGALDLD